MKISMDPGKYWTWVDKPAPIQKTLDGQMVAAKSRYPQKKCSCCPHEVWTYCKCTPGIYLCSHCFANHIEECQMLF